MFSEVSASSVVGVYYTEKGQFLGFVVSVTLQALSGGHHVRPGSLNETVVYPQKESRRGMLLDDDETMVSEAWGLVLAFRSGRSCSSFLRLWIDQKMIPPKDKLLEACLLLMTFV